MLARVALTILAGLGTVLADTTCSATVPCAIGCCGEYGVCGMGPDYCATDVCINSCDAKAECNPDNWASKYVNATTCPLNVCCSQYGFCGTTEEFCGNKTVIAPSCDASSQSIARVIGYYNSAAASRSCDSMAPYSVPQGIYSHLYFAFGSIDPDTFEVVPADQSDETLYPQLEALQIRDFDQELWISIGGWDFSDSDQATASTFSDLVGADTATQNTFFKSLINFMSTYGFTGVDIDWEYPVASERNGRAEDYENYPTFLASLKEALSDYKYGLSITLPTSYWYLQHFDLAAIEPSVDWFNLMTYDLHGTWDETDVWTGPYLDAHTNLTEIKTSLDLLWGVNITASKVNLGLAFYGRSFTLESSSCSTPGCQYLSGGTAGACSQTAGVLFNAEIQAMITEQNLTSTLYEDAAVKTITWDTDQWVSFDDEETWKLKANYAKSVCLGGVMVWAIDEDDDTHTFSKGLAAALGNTININSSTGIPLTISEKDTTTTTVSTQGNYCRFINCGETCPSGFSEMTREDNKKQIMIDSTECLSGAGQTQTLCCPTSSELPSCRWRGFNGGKCNGGCESGEAEVGTITAGCRSGYQSACCTITESTKPWSECAWTPKCHSDDTCPSGYGEFVVGSRNGWGGRRSCKVATENYNYCCKTSVPDAFQNCAWNGHIGGTSVSKYCYDGCPSGAIRIAEEAVDWRLGAGKAGKLSSFLFGNEAYCCNGTTSTITTRSSPLTYADETAYEFGYYLDAWLSNPTCGANEDAEYSATFDTRDLSERSSINSYDDVVYAYLLRELVTWVTSSTPRTDYKTIYKEKVEEHGYTGKAANLSTMVDTAYGYGNAWSGSPLYDVTPLFAQALCDIAESSSGMESLGVASDILCEVPSTSAVSKRMLDGVSGNLRSANAKQPTILAALQGVVNGDLTFHYMRWLSTDTVRYRENEVILELAFWIGPTPGTAPSAGMLATYGDSGDTVYSDLWIVFHLHIPRTASTFSPDTTTETGGLSPGISALGVYHSQTLRLMGSADPRAESRYASTYTGYNTGTLANYNARSQAIECGSGRWYIGINSTANIHTASVWLATSGIISNSNLASIWPAAASVPQGDDGDDGDGDDDDQGWSTVPSSSRSAAVNGKTGYKPQTGAFTKNRNAAGNHVNIKGSTSRRS
ncbi:glycoside hydrolase family 18 protein [Penicillium frequentans]|uniref:chitinase n=1 Tax=Penicillium frequentans TaxID=3151616 RepID=A0AAD6D1T2_9EURO|nr:glycoside hydrolase family 18 protein [Penicillium glabrum]